MLQLPDDPIPAAQTGAFSLPPVTASGRRRPALLSQPSFANLQHPSISSAGSQHDLFGDDAEMGGSMVLHHTSNMQHYLKRGNSSQMLNSSAGLNTSNSSSVVHNHSRAPRHGGHSSMPRKHSASNNHGESLDRFPSSSTFIQPHGSAGAVNSKLGKRHSFRGKNHGKGGFRMGGYSILALGVVDRYGGRDPDLAPWLKRVRCSPMNLKVYESLRNIIQTQRKIYITKLNAIRHKRRANPVGPLLRFFLFCF